MLRVYWIKFISQTMKDIRQLWATSVLFAMKTDIEKDVLFYMFDHIGTVYR